MDTAGLLPTKEMDRVATKSTRPNMHHLVMHAKRDVNIEVYLHPTTLFVAKQSVPNTLTAQFARSDFRSNASVQGRPDSSYFPVNPNPLECARGR
jgi:hypothetical protein